MKNGLQIHIYKDEAGEFRWQMKRSGRIVADCGEGYTTKIKLKDTLSNIKKALILGQEKTFDTSTKTTW